MPGGWFHLPSSLPSEKSAKRMEIWGSYKKPPFIRQWRLLGFLILRSPASIFIAVMTYSLALPSTISLKKLPPNASSSFRASASFMGFRNGFRSSTGANCLIPRVFMSDSVRSQTVIDDSLFLDYKPTFAFLFPGQVSFFFFFLYVCVFGIAYLMH